MDGGFFPNTGGEGLTPIFQRRPTGHPSPARRRQHLLDARTDVAQNLLWQGNEQPRRIHASYNDYRTGEYWQSTEASGGFVQVRKFDADSLLVEVNVKDLLAGHPRSKGSIDFSGLVTVVPGR